MVWLDGGEWEALEASGLHRSIHRIFTAPWQRAIRDESREASYREQLVGRLGADLVGKIESLRKELADHPGREIALAFLHS